MTKGLLQRTENRRVEALATLDPKDQARLGQFFTPDRAAKLIAGLPRMPHNGVLRLLDPGAGAGSLTAAIIQRVIDEAPETKVEITAIEIDPGVSPYLAATLADCESTAADAGVSVTSRLVAGDAIHLLTGLEAEELGPFDLVIMNPPYAKLGVGSAHRKAMQGYGVDCPNLYAAFLAIGAGNLARSGQIVAITPRSFANGPYFEQFRRYLLDTVAIDRIHTFESRSTVFADTGVLQENLVFSATRDGLREKVLLSVSHGHTDESAEHVVDYGDLVKPDDPHRFLRIRTGDAEDTAIAEVMSSMPATIIDLGVQASTGRVVDFRSRECLRDEPNDNTFPLIYPGNVRGGVIEWPRAIRKAQGFEVVSDSDRKMLLPGGVYVVVKRFSAKEERRRIVAAVWEPGANGNTPVAFENHLNIFHDKGAGLDLPLAVGLSFWLNSSAVDRYFRTFSGHTQVNATDLRSLRFPSLESLRALGEGRSPRLPDQDELDAVVEQFALPMVGAQ